MRLNALSIILLFIGLVLLIFGVRRLVTVHLQKKLAAAGKGTKWERFGKPKGKP